MAKLIKGVNDLATLYPEIAKELDEVKSGFCANEVAAHSNKKAHWKCKRGHEWQERVYNRAYGRGCPYCSGRRVAVGENDLKTLYPQLATEWNYGKNIGLNPEDVSPGSNKKVWWICKEGHEWQATIYSRISGNGCPYCSRTFPIKGINDLKTLYPQLATEWNYKKNLNLRPEDVMPLSNKKVWWRCKKGHEWEDTISHRTYGRGCPYCSGRRVLIGDNDLKTLCPHLVEEWNYNKNSNLKPEDVTIGTNKKVWWICKEGHEWEASVVKRVAGTGCPYCSGRLPIKGVTDFATVHPDLVCEWSEDNKVKPTEVAYGTDKKVIWKCKNCGCKYESSVNNRHNGKNCPYCAGRKPIKGKTDLLTKFPEICKDWDYSKNKKKPDEYLPNSTQYAYWKCHKCGCTYKRRIIQEVRSIGCPKCE